MSTFSKQLWRNIMKIRTDSDEEFVRYILEARSEYLSLRLKQEPAIRQIYVDAAANVSGDLARLAPGASDLTRNHLRALEKSLTREAENIRRALEGRLRSDLQQATGLGGRSLQAHMTSCLQAAGLPLDMLKVQRGFGNVNTAAVEAIWARTRNGMKLSDRIWQTSDHARDNIRSIILDGVARGRDSVQVARDLEQYVKHGAATMAGDYPGMMARIGKRVPKDLCYEAFRLARSEMSMAFMEGTYASGRVNPAYKGVRWLLSSSHPLPDVCCRAGTMVQTIAGPRPIEEVNVGDLVLTHRVRWRPVTRLYRHTIAAGSLIRLRYQVAQSRIHEVIVTPNHPVLTEQGWIPAGDLRMGCLGLCLPSELPEQLCRPRHGERHKASQDSGGSGPLSHAESEFALQRDAGSRHRRDRRRTSFPGVRLPSATPKSASDTCQCPNARHPSADCRSLSATQRAACGLRRCARTYWDDACRSWGWLGPSWERMPDSSRLGACYRIAARSLCRMLGKSVAWLRGRLDSTRLSRIAGFSRKASPRILYGTRDTEEARDSTCSSLHTDDCKNAVSQCGWGAPANRERAQSLCRNTRNSAPATPPSCIKYSMPSSNSTWGVLISRESIATDGETVFNLGVGEDNSYVANGIAVHNCDDLASADLYGLGPGGYPAGDEPPYPHANCLCTVGPIAENTQEFVERLKKWRDDPSSEPKLEEWYNEVYLGQGAAQPSAPGPEPPQQQLGPEPQPEPPTLEQAITEKEKLIANLPHERAYVFDAAGTVLLEKDGGKSSVNFDASEFALMKDAVLAHNHPAIGGSFSPEDIHLAAKYDMAEIRAVGKTYRHSASRPAPGWSEQFWDSAIKPSYRRHEADVIREFRAAILSGSMTVTQAEEQHWHEIWTRVAKEVGFAYVRTQW